MINDKFYSILRWACQLAIPGIAALYFGLAKLWNLPYPEEVVGTLAATAAFLGAILGVNSRLYHAKELALAVDTEHYDTVVLVPEHIGEMPEQIYIALKWLTITILPALATLYATVAFQWNLPYPKEVVGTIATLATFLGVMLGISSIEKVKA